MEPRERTHLFATPEAPRLRIRTPSGQVSIETDETTETTVELEPLRSDDVTRTAIAQATVELRGNEVVVEVAKQGWGFLGRLARGRDPDPLSLRLRRSIARLPRRMSRPRAGSARPASRRLRATSSFRTSAVR